MKLCQPGVYESFSGGDQMGAGTSSAGKAGD